MRDCPNFCLKLFKDAGISRKFPKLAASRLVGKGQRMGCWGQLCRCPALNRVD